MFVDRVNGAITSIFRAKQYDGQEELADDAPELLAIAQAIEQAAAAKQAQAATDAQAAESAKGDAVIQFLVNHTPAECAAYVAANVTDLASARNVLAKLAMAVSVLARGLLR